MPKLAGIAKRFRQVKRRQPLDRFSKLHKNATMPLQKTNRVPGNPRFYTEVSYVVSIQRD